MLKQYDEFAYYARIFSSFSCNTNNINKQNVNKIIGNRKYVPISPAFIDFYAF